MGTPLRPLFCPLSATVCSVCGATCLHRRWRPHHIYARAALSSLRPAQPLQIVSPGSRRAPPTSTKFVPLLPPKLRFEATSYPPISPLLSHPLCNPEVAAQWLSRLSLHAAASRPRPRPSTPLARSAPLTPLSTASSSRRMACRSPPSTTFPSTPTSSRPS